MNARRLYIDQNGPLVAQICDAQHVCDTAQTPFELVLMIDKLPFKFVLHPMPPSVDKNCAILETHY